MCAQYILNKKYNNIKKTRYFNSNYDKDNR